MKRLCILFCLLMFAVPTFAVTDAPSQEAQALYELGVDLFWQGVDEAKAANILTEAIELAPDFADAYAMRAGAYRAIGDLDAAEADIEQALALDDENALAYVWRGRLRFHVGKFDEAFADLEYAFSLDANLPEAYFILAIMHDELREYDAAINAISQAIELRDDFTRAYVVRANLYRKSGLYAEALSDLEIAYDLEPDHYHLLLMRARIYADMGNIDAALEDQGRMIALYPNIALGYIERAQTHALYSMYAASEADLQQAEEVGGLTVNFYAAAAYIFSLRGNAPNAIYAYEQALALEASNVPLRAMLFSGLGTIYSQTGQYEKALDMYTQTIVIIPDFHEALFNRGLLYRQLGRYEDAMADFDRALEVASFVLGYYNRGALNQLMGNDNLAISDYTRALELNPYYGPAYLSRGALYYSNYNNTDEMARIVETDLTAAINYLVDDPRPYFYRSQFYMRVSRYEEALIDIDAAIDIRPNNPDYWMQRSMIQSSKGDYDQALADANQLIELEPSNPEFYDFRLITYAFIPNGETLYQEEIAADCEIMTQLGESHYMCGELSEPETEH